MSRAGVFIIIAGLLFSMTAVQKAVAFERASKKSVDGGVKSEEAPRDLVTYAGEGNLEAVKKAIADGADVNQRRDKTGITPLIVASYYGNADVVKLLLEAKADVNAASHVGVTPLYVASQNDHTEIVKLLLAAKADVNAADNLRVAPLYLAAKGGYTEIVKLLLAAKADANAARRDGVTPLVRASYEGYTEIVKLLLEAKADVNAAGNDGVTALIRASQRGHTEIVKLLLAAKADVNKVAFSEGKKYTALTFAKEGDYSEIVTLLEKNGAKK